jgi:serine/threonine protein kinase
MLGEKKSLKIRKDLFISSSNTKNIKEDYEYIRELGSGGYGVVFLAQHKITSKTIITKMKEEQLRLSPKTMLKIRSYLLPKCNC